MFVPIRSSEFCIFVTALCITRVIYIVLVLRSHISNNFRHLLHVEERLIHCGTFPSFTAVLASHTNQQNFWLLPLTAHLVREIPTHLNDVPIGAAVLASAWRIHNLAFPVHEKDTLKNKFLDIMPASLKRKSGMNFPQHGTSEDSPSAEAYCSPSRSITNAAPLIPELFLDSELPLPGGGRKPHLPQIKLRPRNRRNKEKGPAIVEASTCELLLPKQRPWSPISPNEIRCLAPFQESELYLPPPSFLSDAMVETASDEDDLTVHDAGLLAITSSRKRAPGNSPSRALFQDSENPQGSKKVKLSSSSTVSSTSPPLIQFHGSTEVAGLDTLGLPRPRPTRRLLPFFP